MTKLAEIEAAPLRLSNKEHLQLAGKLLKSVPPPLSASNPDEILAEASRRDAEIESGQVKPPFGKRILGRRTPHPAMTVEFHPAVQQDFNEAIAHY